MGIKDFKHHDSCQSNDCETLTSGSWQLLYCNNCKANIKDKLECDHRHQLIVFELDSGMKQLRKYCSKCHSLTSNPEKQNGYDIAKLPHKKLSLHHAFYDQFIENERIEADKLFSTKLQELKKEESKFVKNEYSEYLKTETWRQKRKRVLERDDFKCQICGENAEHIHHLDYAHKFNEYLFELVSLCAYCHREYYHPVPISDYDPELDDKF